MSEKWCTKKLGDVLTLQRGFDLPASVRTEAGKIPVVSSSGISGFHDIYKVEAPGVVTGRYGNIGSVYYINEPFWPLNTTLYVKNFKGNHPLFVYYLLQSINFKKFSDKTGVPGVNRNDLHSLLVNLPPLLEQYNIANVLSIWDRSINLITQLIAVKQERKRGLMQQLLSGQKRLAQFVDPWKTISIGSFLTESRISGTDGKIARKITVKLYGKGVVPKDEKLIGSVATKYYVRRSGQFIYSKLDFLNGAFGLIPSDMDGYESTLDLPCFDFESTIIPQFFLYFVLRESFYSQFVSYALGGRKARRIQVDEFLAHEICVPNLDEQKCIVEILSCCDKEIELLQRKLALFKQQKQGLMQQLLTGKVQVKDDTGTLIS